MESQTFDTWGIVEIMGHLKLAGHLTEQSLAGTAMLRVDVPESNGRPAFSRLFGGGAIYSVTPTTEEVARGVADTLKAAPLTQWDLPDHAGVPADPAITPDPADASRASVGSGDFPPPVPGFPGLEWREDDGLKEWEYGCFLLYHADTKKVEWLVIHRQSDEAGERRLAERGDAMETLHPGSLWLGPLPPPPAFGWGNAAAS